MRILIIHNEYMVQGGERAVVHAQIELLRSKGHQVATLFRSNSELRRATAVERVLLGLQSPFSVSIYRAVQNLVEQERPDIAHVHNVFPLVSPSAYIALENSGIPIVQTLHNFRLICPNGLFFTQDSICERCKFGRYHNAIRFKCYRNSVAMSSMMAGSIGLNRLIGTFNAIDKVIALNPFIASKFIESRIFDREKIVVIPHYLEPPNERVTEFGRRKDEILYLGRLSHEKGVDIAIDAMKQLPRHRLLIAGTGPIRNALEGKLEKQQLDNVEFLGHLAQAAKWDYLQRSKALVIPSRWYEHFPVVILEAMATGTPVIASNHGSMPYIVEHNETGLLFDPGNAPDLTSKVNQLSGNEALWTHLSTTARAVLADQHSREAHYRSLLEVYSQLL